jgi:hypothetical protein
VPVGYSFPESHERRFAVLVESVGAEPVRIVVERAMYWGVQGVGGAGAAALATKLQ